MQMPVLGCTFLTLVTDHQCLDDRPPVPHTSSRPLVPSNAPTCAQQCAHLCPAVRPPVPSNAPTCAQCPPVP
ncbi:unnamed protein product, partial [Staurois parvus]